MPAGQCPAGQFCNPHGIAVDGKGFVYVADTQNHRIEKFAPNGGLVRQWGETGGGVRQFNNPESVATDSKGHLFVGDSKNHRIQEISSETGDFIAQWGKPGPGSRPDGPGEFGDVRWVAVDETSGYLYASDRDNNRVQQLKLPT